MSKHRLRATVITQVLSDAPPLSTRVEGPLSAGIALVASRNRVRLSSRLACA